MTTPPEPIDESTETLISNLAPIDSHSTAFHDFITYLVELDLGEVNVTSDLWADVVLKDNTEDLNQNEDTREPSDSTDTN